LELIQNVEDCDFNYTTDTPSMRFEVNPRGIIIESNQDGFIERDVSGICQVGNSWKRGMPGYVGDKGIGFKSVFGVASRVDIQSNAFSFSLEYNGGDTTDDKLGIITPIVGNHPIPPSQRPLTRMKLTLDGRTPYPALVSDFAAIPKTLLLFLSKLKKISITVDNPDLATIQTTTFSISDEEGQIKCITVQDGESNRLEILRYIVLRAPLTGLPNDSARPGIHQCEGVLAFPIDASDLPSSHLEHDIYAFLPVRTVGFKVSCSQVNIKSPTNHNFSFYSKQTSSYRQIEKRLLLIRIGTRKFLAKYLTCSVMPWTASQQTPRCAFFG
jgi:hypothetical protein